MAAQQSIPLAVLLTAFAACALAQGNAASAPTPTNPAAPPAQSATRANSPATAQTPAAPPATAQTPAAPPVTSPMVTPEGKRAPTPPPPGQLTMTPQEQQQYRQDVERAKTGDECRAVVARQRQQTAQRAQDRGEPAPPMGADPCVGR